MSKSLKLICGRWKVIDWKNQHSFYSPDEDVFDNIHEWQPFNFDKIEEYQSNFLNVAIGKENLTLDTLSNLEIEFAKKHQVESIHHFNIYLNNKLFKQAFWETDTDPEYCDLSIIMGEVYHYTHFKIETITLDELILIERLDNTESDTYLQKITLQKVP